MEPIDINCISEYAKVLQSRKRNPNIYNVIKSINIRSSDDKFKITKHRDGKYPAIITISGFTSEDMDNRENWKHSVLTLFPEHEWFHLEWNAKKNPFSKKVMSTMPANFDRDVKNRLKLDIMNKLNLFPLDILLNNFWHVSVRNSKTAGENLAIVLNACKKKEFILIGHSLGARIIYNCLDYLHQNQIDANILDVHLLGGAVSNSKSNWLKVTSNVKNNIYNYYIYTDLVLRHLYPAGMLSRTPIGISKIDNKKVINLNSNSIVFGHSQYIENFYKIGVKI